MVHGASQDAVLRLLDAPCRARGIPKALALAIIRQESDLDPWVVNVAGKDYHPGSLHGAATIARRALAEGKSFDVGLMQVNSYWIKKYGWPLEKVIEPRGNVRIGTWILGNEIRRHGLNWKAVAYYHTPLHKNPKRGVAYAKKVIAHMRNILSGR